ncbi:polysaccharide lyase family 8 super-sandwich domain-containing protein [Flavobacterium sp. UMI-01]|uniref:polysaccharide lyase family 8 super-sandwich domain-containing protein n=1 Tax=Flavobacterium sp. UMI-01 TaxID=1441053 RepID=UPI001C7D611A|nr:polysaccharide lyase family 8 super-sandwich domain-containing protein [Flavobacterium sp. UMI-01]GIZ09522.1 chondroitinase [Flavobacterium sp. UMI-01]
MKKNYWLLVFLIFSITSFSQSNKAYPHELQQLFKNIKEKYLEDAVPTSEVEHLLASLDAKGAWPGIDYSSQQRGHWPVLLHLLNLNRLSKAYLKEGSNYYQKPEVLDKIHLALDYWLANDFVSPNWWYPQIGIPQQLAPVLIVMEDKLSDKQLQTGVKILNKAKIGMGGQNKVWLAGNVLYKSLLVRNIDSVNIASKAIQGELKVSTDLGIQPDNSFHEHGAMLQQGNYGLSYLGDMIKWIAVLRHTPFAFDEEKVAIIREFALDGTQWFLWKKNFDIGGSGRQLFQGELAKKQKAILKNFKQLEKLDPEFASVYNKAQDYKSLSGNKHFWNSDFHISRTPNYLFTLKMSSSRVNGYETVNFENMLGYHLGSGMTLLYQSDNEYLDVFPFWDWKKLPGTTIIQDDAPIPVSNAWGYKIEGDFVGGVTDGTNGLAVLQYNRGGLQANKAWFMLDNQIVCLGNGITADTPFNVTTGINQVYRNGAIVVKNKSKIQKATGKQDFTNPSWILHDRVGYLFPSGGKVSLVADTVSGSWYKVAQRYKDETIKADIFNVYLNHGTKPKEADYQYILVPNATQQQLIQLEKKPLFEIKNAKSQQIVSRKDGSLAGIVFYEAGKVDLFGGISVSEPCLLLVEKQDSGLKVTVSDPTHKLTTIRVAFDKKYKNEQLVIENNQSVLNLKLPDGNEAGKSVTFMLQF